MLKAKSCFFNIYALLIKQQRLKISTLFLAFCFIFTSCAKNAEQRLVSSQNRQEISETAININTASAGELEKLPRIGKEISQRIVEYREKYGAFRRPEELILVRGMSDKKFREMKNLVKVE